MFISIENINQIINKLETHKEDCRKNVSENRNELVLDLEQQMPRIQILEIIPYQDRLDVTNLNF